MTPAIGPGDHDSGSFPFPDDDPDGDTAVVQQGRWTTG